MTSPFLFRYLALGAASAVLGGVLAEAATLKVAIEPVIGGKLLKLDSQDYKNAAGETYSVVRLSYIVSGLALQRGDGTWLELPDAIAWMDAAKGRAEFSLEKVDEGNYRALRFQVGLDDKINRSDLASFPPTHPLNPNVNGLQWPMLGGYIFMALEGGWQGAGTAKSGYAMHLAREPFRTAVLIPGQLRVTGDSLVRLHLDVAKIWNGVQAISFGKDGSTTHSKDGDPVAGALKANLANAFSLSKIEAIPPTGASPTVSGDTKSVAEGEFFTAGKSFPRPALPADNPLSAERIALGRRLFNEAKLSRDGTISCASCHQASAALSDARRFSVGVEGRTGDRNGMPLFNLAWKSSFFWDGRAPSLRAQALMPIVDHREMDEQLDRVVGKLKQAEGYAAEFEKAFGSSGITAERIGLALENFMLTLTSYDSKFDRAQRGEVQLTADEQRGLELFNMEREPRLGTMGADCFHCHGGPLFTDHQFRNNGLAVDAADTGRHRVTGVGIDKGAFSTPSLRNVALTAPYMHDGRFATLEEVIDHYSNGVKRTDSLDPNLAKHPEGGLKFSDEDKRCLIAFLKTLTDNRFTQKATP